MERRGRGAKAREAREVAGLNAGHPARCRAPREPIPVRHLRRPSAPRTRRPGRRVGTSLSSRFSSLLPGAHVGGAAWGCAMRGVGRPRPPGPQPPRRGPGAPSSGPSRPAEIRGTQTYSVGGTSREPADHAPHPPRHSRDAPGGSPSPSTDWGRNGERSGNGGGVRKRGGGSVCREATQSPPDGIRRRGIWKGVGDGNGRVGNLGGEMRRWQRY